MHRKPRTVCVGVVVLTSARVWSSRCHTSQRLSAPIGVETRRLLTRGRVSVGTRAEIECLSREIGKRARQNRANIRSDQDEKHCKRLLNRDRLQGKGLLFFLYSSSEYLIALFMIQSFQRLEPAGIPARFRRDLTIVNLLELSTAR